jgi:transposase
MAGFAAATGQLAYDFHTVFPVEQDRCVGSCFHSRERRSRSRGSVLRQYGDTGAFACCRRPKKHGAQALGRSRGGFGSKVHCVADALGNPIAFTVTGAEQADITQAHALLEKAIGAQAITADKGYDSDALVSAIQDHGAQANIPPRSNRKTPRAYDLHCYNARHLIENLFARLKQFRRIATRFEKLARNFAAMVTLACICVWLA